MPKEYVLLGHPLGHSLSPWIHARLFAETQQDATYALLDLSPEMLPTSRERLGHYAGYNVTIPYKMEIIPLLDEITSAAADCGAVNCVLVQDGKQLGYNTDRDGFLRSIPTDRLERRVLLLGCGGAGHMMATEAARRCANLTIALRRESLAKHQAFAKHLKESFSYSTVELVAFEDISGAFDLLLNATPIGMFPHENACPVSETVIRRCGMVFDAIYRPVNTQLLNIAEMFGIPTVDGVEMLVRQAACAHEVWYGARFTEMFLHGLITDARRQLQPNRK